MQAIRTKDKIFLALVGPIALTAAYFWLWRADAGRRVDALAREDAALVAVEDYPLERPRAERLLAAAQESWIAEEKVPMPAAKVKAQADDSPAARERAALGIFRLAGLTVERSHAAENGDSAIGSVLSRTGARPSPVCRQYALVGSYPQVRAALRAFADREMAVIPDRVEMTKRDHWTLTLWL